MSLYFVLFHQPQIQDSLLLSVKAFLRSTFDKAYSSLCVYSMVLYEASSSGGKHNTYISLKICEGTLPMVRYDIGVLYQKRHLSPPPPRTSINL